MPRETKQHREGYEQGRADTEGQIARTVLSLDADRLEASAARLTGHPDAVSALNECVAVLRDAANVVDPDNPQEVRTEKIADGA